MCDGESERKQLKRDVVEHRFEDKETQRGVPMARKQVHPLLMPICQAKYKQANMSPQKKKGVFGNVALAELELQLVRSY